MRKKVFNLCERWEEDKKKKEIYVVELQREDVLKMHRCLSTRKFIKMIYLVLVLRRWKTV